MQKLFKPGFRFALITLIAYLIGTQTSEAKDYRILILPSGGATGIVPATVLTHLEKGTGKPVYKLFDEIWSSSIGAVTASLLTTPKHKLGDPGKLESKSEDYLAGPMPAAQVTQFIEGVFARYHTALGIRGQFRKLIPAKTTMSDTLIPIRILSAEVVSWFRGVWPKQTELRGFCREENPDVLLSSVACSSCTVFPIHPRTEQVQVHQEQKSSVCKTLYCLDAGSEVCTKNSMNPLWHLMKQFSKNLDADKDTVSVYFLSNGWVRLHPSYGTVSKVLIPGDDGKNVPVTLYNVDMNIKPAILAWQRMGCTGKLLGRCKKDYIDYNVAGSGMIPLKLLKKEAHEAVERSEAFQAMLEDLKKDHK